MDTVRQGSRGDAVTALQKKLLSQGINPGTIDGVFGPKTEAAVKRYQEQKGLQADGIAGPKTFTALGLMGTETPEVTEVAQQPEPSGPVREARTREPDEHRVQKAAQVEVAGKATTENRTDAVQAIRDAEKQAEARTEAATAASGAEAMKEALRGAKMEAEKPKGFKARIAAMRKAKKERDR